jgi:hypothetical protein
VIEKRCWKDNIPRAVSAVDLIIVTMSGAVKGIISTTELTKQQITVRV